MGGLRIALGRRPAPMPLARPEHRQGPVHHFALGGKLELLDGLFDGKPAHVVGLMIVVAHVALNVTQQKEMDAFIDATRLAFFCLIAIGIADIAELSDKIDMVYIIMYPIY